MSTTTAGEATASAFVHMIYPYADDQQYLTGTLAYIDRARAAGGTVVLAASPARREALAARLGDHDAVSFIDTAALGRNPARLIPAWQEWIGERARTGSVHGVNETSGVFRPGARDGQVRYQEWLLNLAFAKAPMWTLMCPVATSAVPAAAIEALTRCHPLVWDGGSSLPSAQYLGENYPFDPLPEPGGAVEQLDYDLGTLQAVRRKTAAWAAASGLPDERVVALTLAASEVATNSISHGGGRGVLRLWSRDGSLVCEARDQGVIRDPLVGIVRPSATEIGGRGLWFANQLCDLVEIRSTVETGTCVRLWMDLPQ